MERANSKDNTCGTYTYVAHRAYNRGCRGVNCNRPLVGFCIDCGMSSKGMFNKCCNCGSTLLVKIAHYIEIPKRKTRKFQVFFKRIRSTYGKTKR